MTLIEAVVATAVGIAARSLLPVALGIDSTIELTSGIVVLRRFRIELNEESEDALHSAKAIELKTALVAGYLLFLLSAYVIRCASPCPR